MHPDQTSNYFDTTHFDTRFAGWNMMLREALVCWKRALIRIDFGQVLVPRGHPQMLFGAFQVTTPFGTKS